MGIQIKLGQLLVRLRFPPPMCHRISTPDDLDEHVMNSGIIAGPIKYCTSARVHGGTGGRLQQRGLKTRHRVGHHMEQSQEQPAGLLIQVVPIGGTNDG